MKVSILILAVLSVLLAAACAGPRSSSEREWQRAQCAQIIDGEAREKCMKRVDSE